MAVEPLPVPRCAQDGHAVVERQQPGLRLGLEAPPVSRVLFRPEEVDPASDMGEILAPVPDGNVHVGVDPPRLAPLNDSVAHLHPHGIPAVQTWGIDYDRLSRKQPADRQRLQSSLGEPLLVPVHGDAVLRGEVVKGGERGDQVRARVEPDGKRKP